MAAAPTRSILTPPLLINPITGLQVQSHEEARLLWEAAGHYLSTIQTTPENRDRYARIQQVFSGANRAFGTYIKKSGKSVEEIHAAFWEKLEDEKQKLRNEDTTGLSEEERKEFVREMIGMAKGES